LTAIERLQRTGIRRLGTPRSGFRYRAASGSAVARDDLRRIRGLAIPPAWTDVSISASPTSLLQAIGRDRAGRWQYRYSPVQTRLREGRKRRRLAAFLSALPGVRARVARDLRQPGLSREKVLAGLVQILLRGALRPGSSEYARSNGTFGLATLRPRHATVTGATVVFRYPGKGGKVQEHRIEDPRVARLVRRLLRRPGRRLFRWQDENGAWLEARRRSLNDYLREASGGPFTAKDFRTWAGTLLGACALAEAGIPSPPTRRAIRSGVMAAMRATAAALGNTPAVCRASYVSARVVEAYERGRVVGTPLAVEALLSASPRTLARLERSVRRLLSET
jgi:DNA topoisomerase-1